MGAEPVTGSSTARTVAVLGGGLAGLSAARRLLELGFGVTLVEKRPFLGGRAFSFRDAESGVEIDNGQHVFLGCNRHYLDYLREIGAVDQAYIQDRLRADVVLNGVRGVLSSTPWLGKLHLFPSLVKYPHLTVMDKLRAAYALLAMKLTDPVKNGGRLDGETGYQWLRRRHQSERAIENLWNLIVLPALNDDVRHVTAGAMLMVFREALLQQPADATMGIARVGLTALAGEPSQAYIEARGGELRLGRGVRAIRLRDGRVAGVEMQDGSVIEADAYVSALPFDVMLDVLPDAVADGEFFANARGLKTAPIVGLHIWYDRPVMDERFAAFLDSPVQWVFNKSLIQGAGADEGQYVCVSLSGAWEHVDKPKEELRKAFTQEMARLFPAARESNITRFLVVKERRATFRSIPGAAEHRLPQTTPIPNLVLAGDWTRTGWPSTMEGAVLSGVLAADALAAQYQAAR